MKALFIQSEEHFINFLNKTIRFNIDKVDPNKLMSIKFYIENIYKKNIADEYTWKLKNDFEYLYENKLFNFIKSNKMIKGAFRKIEENTLYTKYNWTKEFIDLFKTLNKKAGVYIFDSARKRPLYIGQSINLQERILSSFNERFLNYHNKVYLKCVICESAIDSCILEVYLIGKLKPVLNSTSKYKGKATIIIDNIPKYTNRVLCINPTKKE